MFYRAGSALLCPRPTPLLPPKLTVKRVSFRKKKSDIPSLHAQEAKAKGLELYLWDFTGQLLQAHWVPGVGRRAELSAGPWLCTEGAAVLGDWPWVLTEDVSGWALCSAHALRAFSLFTAKKPPQERHQEKGALLCCMQDKK